MGRIYFPKPVKLVVSIFGSQAILLNYYKDLLIKEFGSVDQESDIQSFNFTEYYREEFGNGLIQKLYSFENLIKPERLSQIKIKTNTLEYINTDKIKLNNKHYPGPRKVNIDPGYISLDKFILASTKNGPARIYLNNGIYAEITLRFINKSFVPVEFTYSNYKTENFIDFLNKIRQIYKLQLRRYSTEI